MLKLSLKQGQYVNIGDDIRVVYVGGSGNHARLLIDAPRELNIARSTTEENPARKRETYYAEPGISREAQQEIKRILWNERIEYIGCPFQFHSIRCAADLHYPVFPVWGSCCRKYKRYFLYTQDFCRNRHCRIAQLQLGGIHFISIRIIENRNHIIRQIR